ncbi:MAG: CapA family protein [Patescibacteria group bacterium]
MLTYRNITFLSLLLSSIFFIATILSALALASFLPSIVQNIEEAKNKQSVITPTDTKSEPAHLLFIGDIMLARGVEWQIAKHSIEYPLIDITEYLSTPDLTIGNFEGTIRNETNQEMDGFTFDTTPEIANMIAKSGIDVVSLSNNHSDNYGSETLEYTRETITELGMTPFGDPNSSENLVSHVTVKDIQFAFIGFHAFTEEPESILNTIRSEKTKGNFVIIFPHWGNEYEETPSIAQTEAAYLFVDAGADAIIGSHPHVIQTYETYKGIPIVYSLGNFLFDQDWSVPTQQGLTLKFDIDSESISLSFVPISIIKSHVTLMNPDDATKILTNHNIPSTLKISRLINQNTQAPQ